MNQPPSPNLICPILLTIYEDPISLPCGHVVSREPLIEYFKTNQICPVCRTEAFNFDPSTAPKCFAIDSMVQEYIKSQEPPKPSEIKEAKWSAKISPLCNNNSVNQTVIGKLEITNTDNSVNFKTLLLTVIDISGSMAGKPIEQCKYSLNRIIDLSYKHSQLTSNVITYHDRASNYTINTTEPQEVYRQKASLLGKDSGGTSFTSAFNEIIKVCTQYAADPLITSMVTTFLTDGEDSSIQKDKRHELVKSLKDNLEKVWTKPYTIHCVGFGGSHDSDFLNGLRLIGTSEGCYRYADPQEDADSLSNKINSILDVVATSSSIPLTLVPTDNMPKIISSDNTNYWLNLTGFDLTKPLEFHISVNNEHPFPLIAEIADENCPKIQDQWFSQLIDQIASELLVLSNQKEDTLDKQIHCELLEQRSRAISSRLDSTGSNYQRLERLVETLKAIRKNEAVNQLKLNDMRFEGAFKTQSSGNQSSVQAVPQGSQQSYSYQVPKKNEVWDTIPKLKTTRCDSSSSSKEFLIMIGTKNNKDLTEWLTNHRDQLKYEVDVNGSNALIVIASLGKLLVKTAYDLNICPLNATNNLGFTALDMAILYGYWKTAEFLIEKGGNTNQDGDLLLQTCISNRYYNTASVLLKNKIATVTDDMVDHAPSNEAISWLSARSQKDIDINTAIKKGMFDVVSDKINTISTISWKPFMEIFVKSSAEHCLVVDMLLNNKKADAEELIEIIDEGEKGVTWPLFATCEKGQVQMFKVLLKYVSRESLNRQNHKGTTLMWISACNGHIDIVMELLNRGANPNIANLKGDSPLIPCCQKGNMSIVELLLEAGADLNLYNPGRDNPVLICCRTGQAKILDVLLKRYIDNDLVKILNTFAVIDGFVPLLASTELDKVECIKVCIKYGADIEARSADDNQIIAGATSLHLAAFYGRLASLRTLVELGADVKSQTRVSGQTALHIAIKQKHLNVVRYLLSLEKGKECLHIQDDEGRLPSFYASIDGNEELLSEFFTNRLALGLGKILMSDQETEMRCSQTLVKYGQSLGCYEFSDVTNIDLGNGSTILAYSLLNGNKYLLESLRKMGANINQKDDFGISPAFWEAYLGYNNNPSPEVTKMIENINSSKKLSMQNKLLLNLQAGGPKMIESKNIANALIKMSDGYGAKVSNSVLAILRASQDEQSLLGFVDKLKNKKEFNEGSDVLDYIVWDAKINIIKRLANNQTNLQPLHILALYLYTSSFTILKSVNDTLVNWQQKSIWHPFIETLYQGIKLIEPYVGEVYRGVDYAFDPDTYTINNIVEWNAFSLCSSEFRTASDLIKKNKGIVFIIQSITGRKIDKFSKNPAESEVMFLPQSQFRVKSYYKANLICLGQANIRTQTFKISEKDIERACKGECIIIELEEIDKSILAIK